MHRNDLSLWSCFADRHLGLAYRSRMAAVRSEIDLDSCATTELDGSAELVRNISSEAQRLDAMRISETTLWKHLCSAHRIGGTTRPVEGMRHDNRVGGGDIALATDVIVVNLEDAMMPMLVDSTTANGVTRSTRQDYLDDMRRREAVSATLESLRIALQKKRCRPLVFAFAYGREANVRTIRDLVSGGCTYIETPVFSCTEQLFSHLESMLHDR